MPTRNPGNRACQLQDSFAVVLERVNIPLSLTLVTDVCVVGNCAHADLNCRWDLKDAGQGADQGRDCIELLAPNAFLPISYHLSERIELSGSS